MLFRSRLPETAGWNDVSVRALYTFRNFMPDQEEALAAALARAEAVEALKSIPEMSGIHTWIRRLTKQTPSEAANLPMQCEDEEQKTLCKRFGPDRHEEEVFRRAGFCGWPTLILSAFDRIITKTLPKIFPVRPIDAHSRGTITFRKRRHAVLFRMTRCFAGTV